MPYSSCTTCRRPATLIVTGRRPGKSLYSSLSCDRCADKHRKQAAKAGPVTEEALDSGQDPLF